MFLRMTVYIYITLSQGNFSCIIMKTKKNLYNNIVGNGNTKVKNISKNDIAELTSQSKRNR